MKQTSSHTSSFRGVRKQKDHLEILDRTEEDPSNIDVISKINEEDQYTIPYDIERDLEFNLDKYSEEVKEELKYLLVDLLKYPSTKMAYRHRCANRLGYHDLKHIKNKLNGESTYTSSNFKPDRCEDCELLVQEKQISTCSSIWQFPKAGIATFNLYKNMKLVMVKLFLLGAIFTIINLYVNLTVSQSTATMTGETFPIFFSNALQILNSTSNTSIELILQVSGFLLIIVIIAWWIANFVMTCLSQKYHRIVDQAHLSSSDFSITLKNVPIYFSQQKLEVQVNRYHESLVFNHNIKNTYGQILKPFTINKICRTIPFSLSQSEVLDRELEGLDQDIVQKKQLFADWVFQMKQNSKFSYTRSERQRQYSTFEKMVRRRKEKVKEMETRAREQYQKANEKVTTTIIVSFDYCQSADIIEHLNPQTLPAKIRYFISFCKSTQYFDIRDFMSNEESSIVVSRAPQPEDIVWGNVEVPLCLKIVRKLLTWLLMLVLSGTLFGIVWGLSIAQVNGSGQWTSVLIGLAITLFNMLSKFVLRKTSPYERDFTETDRQRGILLKGLFVMAVNWVVPIVVTNVANQNRNFYSTNGLACEVFYIAIFQTLLPPLVRIFDPEHFFRTVESWWRNWPSKKIVLKQSELNDYIQHSQYELGWSYLYFIDIMFFCCFYVTLQPGIVICGLLGCVLMFWAQKYVLLNRSQRPQKVAKALTDTVQTLFSLCPFIIWVGHLSWINAMIPDFSSMIFTGNMILMALSILYFLTPWRTFYLCAFHIPQEELLFYDDCRQKFSTQYDRLNPVTLQHGFNDYANYLQGKKRIEDEQKMDNLNNSSERLGELFDTRYVIKEISKIPSIFGRKNNVARKIDGQDTIKPRHLKGQDIELHLVPPRDSKDSRVRHSKSSKVYVQSNLDVVYPENKRRANETEQYISKDKQPQEDIFSHVETQKNVILNMSSNGNTFGRRKNTNEKRKTISVIDRPQEYNYSHRQQKSRKE